MAVGNPIHHTRHLHDSRRCFAPPTLGMRLMVITLVFSSSWLALYLLYQLLP
jgi:hypothetical protein